MVEAEQALFGERVNELNNEEHILGGFLLHQMRQRRGAPGFAAKRVGDQLPDVVAAERRKRDLLDPCACVSDCFELAHQGMRVVDLIVPIGADQHQGPQI